MKGYYEPWLLGSSNDGMKSLPNSTGNGRNKPSSLSDSSLNQCVFCGISSASSLGEWCLACWSSPWSRKDMMWRYRNSYWYRRNLLYHLIYCDFFDSLTLDIHTTNKCVVYAAFQAVIRLILATKPYPNGSQDTWKRNFTIDWSSLLLQPGWPMFHTKLLFQPGEKPTGSPPHRKDSTTNIKTFTEKYGFSCL